MNSSTVVISDKGFSPKLCRVVVSTDGAEEGTGATATDLSLDNVASTGTGTGDV